MTDCHQFQEAMDEVLGLGGTTDEFSPECRSHLRHCSECQVFVEESLELNRLMEEPVPFPPEDMVNQVMARIEAEQAPEARLPWAERFAWAASGAVAMYCVERIPQYSSSLWTTLESVLSQSESLLKIPMTISPSFLILMALSLLLIQTALIYRTRALV